MRHVIVGAGPAGVIAAETLRRVDPGSDITLIGDEDAPPYSRMALPYYLAQNIDEAGTYLRKRPDHYEEASIRVRQGRVESVHAKDHTLTLEGGEERSWDRLLIATGARPVSPPIPGTDLPGVHPCWTLEDARHIARLAQPGGNVVLMGAGFIGCIILEALAQRKVNLTVIEMEDRMVPRMMDQVSGNLLKKWCADKGVVVRTSTRVEVIEQKAGALQVKLGDGKVLKADLVISATGVRPNIEFLQGTGIKVDHGVLVDEHLCSSVPDIYAAGDVCQGKDFSTGDYSVQAIQPTAVEHGRIAALGMCGRNAVHQGCVNMNVLDTMGLISSSYGLWMGCDGGDAAGLCDEGRFRYLNLQFKEDVLIGAQSLGLTAHVGVLRGLIQGRLRLGKWKERLVNDPTRLMEAYLGTTQAIGHNAGVFFQ